MTTELRHALAVGYERMAAWADLLDRINVFPVADGDTGRNLVTSLAALRREDISDGRLIDTLLMAARGNSGNIGARFVEGLLGERSEGEDLLSRALRARDLAYGAVADPKPGTMLSVFDALCDALLPRFPTGGEDDWVGPVVDRLVTEVHATTDRLPALREAGVVDAGALGMLLLLDGALRELAGGMQSQRDVAREFSGLFAYAPSRVDDSETGFCVDAVLRAPGLAAEDLERVEGLGESVVCLRHGDLLKVHLHTPDREAARARLGELGEVVGWASDDLERQTRAFARPSRRQAIHVVTDGAGSVGEELAESLGLTVLDSYVNVDRSTVPETCLAPEDLYRAMRRGAPVSTAQASIHERQQHYASLLALHPGRLLYLCVGSFYTGNHETVTAWAQEHDPDGRLEIIDSGAASGRLGVVAVAAARRALATEDAQEVVDFARAALQRAEEYVFLEQLKYLAAGGRLSRTSAFFGDLLSMKPVISPLPEGARKVAVVRKAADQLAYAVARLKDGLAPEGRGLVLLEHSDNRSWVEGTVLPAVQAACPSAEILLVPLSLTSGAHMGPGTWGVALLKDP